MLSGFALTIDDGDGVDGIECDSERGRRRVDVANVT